MRSLTLSLARVLVSGAAGMLVGIVTWLVIPQATLNSPAPSVFIVPTALVGLAAGFGSVLSLRIRAGGRHRLAWIASLLAVSLLYGAAAVLAIRSRALAGQDTMALGLSEQGLVVLLALPIGIALVARLITSGCGWSAAWRDGFVALALMLAGGMAFALGFGLLPAITYSNPCPSHGYCLKPTPWAPLGIALVAALVIGLWLGIAAWLAIVAGETLRSRDAASSGSLPTSAA